MSLDIWKVAEKTFGGFFLSEEDCFDHIFVIRYPEGFHCDICDEYGFYSKFYRTYKDRSIPIYQCCTCGHQTSVIANTIFHRSRLPMVKWFYAIILLNKDQKLSVYRLHKLLFISTSTAQRMKKNILDGIRKKDPLCDMENYPVTSNY